MKKLLSVLLVVALTAACVCGCKDSDGNNTSSEDTSQTTSVVMDEKGINIVGDISNLKPATADKSFAESRTFETGEAAQWGLDNSYYKLTKKKQLNVAFTGGSVTVGTGSNSQGKNCWRTYTEEWLKKTFPDAAVNEIGAYIGATSSSWAIARFKREVIEQNPDLLFIEYSVNDIYTGLNPDTSAAIMDGMIRELNKALPECDVVVISVPNQETYQSDSTTRNAHKNAALYNGAMFLDMQIPLKEAIEKQKQPWSYFITDSVHPNEIGYKVYSDYITSIFADKFADAKKRGVNATVKHTVPEKPYTSNSNLRNQTLWLEDLKHDDNAWKVRGVMKKQYFAGKYQTLRAKEVGANLTFKFEGDSFAAFGDFQKGSKVKFTLDGGNETYLGFSKDNSGENLIYDNLALGVVHTVTLTVEGKGLCSLVAVYMG